jgi:putative nucleotide binding protein
MIDSRLLECVGIWGMNMMQRQREEIVIVLDFLINGYASDRTPMHLKTPIVQAIGTNNFTILELVPKKGVHLQPFDKVYIGEEKREQIHHINGKIPYEKLSSTAKSELEPAIKNIVLMNEQRFVEFFNKAQPINTRMHTFELLPGIGKKHMNEIVDQRGEKPFESFADLNSRVKLMQDPLKLIVKRILLEIEGNEKHSLFVYR